MLDGRSSTYLLQAARRPLRLALRSIIIGICHAALQLCRIHRLHGFHLLLDKSWWQRCHLSLHVGHLLRCHPAHLVHGLHIWNGMSNMHFVACSHPAIKHHRLTSFIISGFIFGTAPDVNAGVVLPGWKSTLN